MAPVEEESNLRCRTACLYQDVNPIREVGFLPRRVTLYRFFLSWTGWMISKDSRIRPHSLDAIESSHTTPIRSGNKGLGKFAGTLSMTYDFDDDYDDGR